MFVQYNVNVLYYFAQLQQHVEHGVLRGDAVRRQHLRHPLQHVALARQGVLQVRQKAKQNRSSTL